jgi:hypothetical protein
MLVWLWFACHHEDPPCLVEYTGAVDTGLQHDGERKEGDCGNCVASLADHCAQDPTDCPGLPEQVSGCAPQPLDTADTNGNAVHCGDVTRVDCSYEALGSSAYYFRANRLIGIYTVSARKEYCRNTSSDLWYGEVAALDCRPE